MVIIHHYRDIIRVEIRHEPNFSELIKRIKELPGAEFVKREKCWIFPAPLLHRLINNIYDVIDSYEIIDYDWKSKEIKLPADERLYRYQKIGAGWLQTNRRGILADEMGLGKTVQAIKAAVEPVLVVCPAFLLKKWRSEIKYWVGREANIYRAQRKFRNHPWQIISWGNLKNKKSFETMKQIFEENGFVPKTVIADEAHYAKNPTSSSSKNLLSLVKGYNPERVYLLTGTPSTTGDSIEFFSLMKLCGLRMTRQHFERAFREMEEVRIWKKGREIRFFKFKDNKNKDILRELIKRYMLRRTVKEVFPELPPVIYDVIELEATPAVVEAEMKLIEMFQEASILASDSPFLQMLDPDAILDARGKIAQELLKFRQVVSREKIHTTVEMAKEIFYEESAIIFCGFIETVDEISNKLKAEGVKVYKVTGKVSPSRRGSIVDRLKTERGILVVTTESIGMGLDLDFIRVGIVHDWEWSPAVMSQAIKRLHRLTTRRRPVFKLPVYGAEKIIVSKIYSKSREFRDVTDSEIDSTGLKQVVAKFLYK